MEPRKYSNLIIIICMIVMVVGAIMMVVGIGPSDQPRFIARPWLFRIGLGIAIAGFVGGLAYILYPRSSKTQPSF